MLGKPITKENLEAAALKTFTGKWAKSKGYTKVELYDAKNQLEKIQEIRDIEKIKEIVFTFNK
ncbi:molybdopterin-converting factor subunit 2 [Flavobacterium columnare]|uniref:molybdopterin-converting factor subunit 2 n=1 Tax=Flavobacterium columnare TaxID=996 RepID=UPI002D2081CD|nr:molybdopterin-converting factor subunit 2 [Flavobacterium columnare]MEB3801496.1 molybdopterin-converting factor subunit 2 [Flavobacterium columnare]